MLVNKLICTWLCKQLTNSAMQFFLPMDAKDGHVLVIFVNTATIFSDKLPLLKILDTITGNKR